MVSLLLWWDPVHTASCVHSKSGISVSPVLWSSCIHALLVFKAKCCGASFWYQSFRLGSLTWDSELLWENSCDVIILKFVGSPRRSHGIWLYIISVLLLSHCDFFFAFGYRISFLVGSRFFFFMVVQHLIVIWYSNDERLAEVILLHHLLSELSCFSLVVCLCSFPLCFYVSFVGFDLCLPWGSFMLTKNCISFLEQIVI